jgi:predicted  nucleic acid-binding Zn-ribbon protein
MYAKTVKTTTKKLDKHKQHNHKNTVRQTFSAIKRQKAKLSPKKSPVESSFCHTEHRSNHLRKIISHWKKNRYLASYFPRGKYLVSKSRHPVYGH